MPPQIGGDGRASITCSAGDLDVRRREVFVNG